MRATARVAATGLGCVLLVLAMVGCSPTTYTVQVTSTSLTLPCGGGTTVQANWAFPDGLTPTGLIYLQHGFARSKDNVSDLTKKYAARGWVVVAPSLGSFGSCTINELPMHQAIAAALVDSTNPASAFQTSANAARSALGLAPLTLPSAIVLSGHSAGGALVTVVGGIIASNPSPTVKARLKGIVLLDPVENANNGMAAALPNLTTTKLLTISGGDSSCNSNSSGTKALLPTRSGFAGVRLPTGCHCDAEADSTDGLCTLVCGTPKQANKDALRELAPDWASDMFRGTTAASSYPGGTYYEDQKTAGTIQTLTGGA